MAAADTAGRRPPAAPRPRNVLALPATQRWATTVVFLLIFTAYFFWLGDTFVTADGRMVNVHQGTAVIVLGLAAVVTLMVGQFDLSIAGMAALTSFLAIGLSTLQGWPFALVLATCLLIGLVGGILNGLLVIGMRVNAFIATLGTGGIFLGLAGVYSGGATLSTQAEGPKLPAWFTGPGSLGDFTTKAPTLLSYAALLSVVVVSLVKLHRARPERISPTAWTGVVAAVSAVIAALILFAAGEWVENVSWLIIVLFSIGTVLWILTTQTTLGRHMRATGYNAVAGRLAGVQTNRVTIFAFALGGILAATAGIVLASTQGSAAPTGTAGLLLPAFAAAFLSTVVLSAGPFTIWGTILGGIFVTWVAQGLILGGLIYTWTDFINGAVLIVAVAVSTTLRRRET